MLEIIINTFFMSEDEINSSMRRIENAEFFALSCLIVFALVIFALVVR